MSKKLAAHGWTNGVAAVCRWRNRRFWNRR